MPITVQVKERVIREMGTYEMVLSGVSVGARKPFGAPKDAKEEPCLDWEFFCSGDEKAFYLTTGVEYGNPKATCTKVINALLGGDDNLPPPDTIRRIDWERVAQSDQGKIIFMLAKEKGNDGEHVNRVTGFGPVAKLENLEVFLVS